MKANAESKRRYLAISSIARAILGITLEEQRSDRFDFCEHHVSSIKHALIDAYEAGRKSVDNPQAKT